LKPTPTTKTAFVLDCSIAMSWCFADECDAYAESVLDQLRSAQAVVPSLWRLEAANVLLVAERRGRITRSESTRLTSFLTELPIMVDEESALRGLGIVLDLGRDHGLTAYDAAYLELAIRLGVPLATLDRQLSEAARSAGVSLLEIS
jgi:predicted nucleic acid-binding protein